VARVCKHYDRETLEGRNKTAPLDDSDYSSVGHSISFAEVVDDQNDQVSNGDQCDNTRVLERIKTAKECEGNDNEPMGISNVKSKRDGRNT